MDYIIISLCVEDAVVVGRNCFAARISGWRLRWANYETGPATFLRRLLQGPDWRCSQFPSSLLSFLFILSSRLYRAIFIFQTSSRFFRFSAASPAYFIFAL